MDTIGYGGIPLLVTGISLALFGWWAGWRARAIAEAARHWPTTNATITRRSIFAYRGSYAPKVRYSYTIAGQGFTGRRLRPGFVNFNRRAAAEEAIAAYPVGAQVTARYDPEKPKRAYLNPEPLAQGAKGLIIVSGITSLIGAGMLVVGMLHLFPDGGRQLAGDEHRWSNHQKGRTVDLYYDVSTMQRRPDGVHVIERMNYSRPQPNGALFMVSETVYDCAGHRLRLIHGTFYDREGQRIGEEDWPDEPFEANPAGSIGGAVERSVCANAAPAG